MITVAVDDLAALAADAVVRPAGESLEPAAAVATRLDQAAGDQFAEQRRVSSPLEAGAAVVTGGGDLVAPFVLHTVIRDSASPVARAKIRRALVSAWQRAGDWGLARDRGARWWAPDGGGLSARGGGRTCWSRHSRGARPARLPPSSASWWSARRTGMAVEAIVRRSA